MVVDHNLEEVWEFRSAQQFYFLGRETRKLEALAWSDETMQLVADQVGGCDCAANCAKRSCHSASRTMAAGISLQIVRIPSGLK